VEWRAALIVYPDPKRRHWQLLYKSNPCPTVEDAAFEVKCWVEEDMAGVLDKMDNGSIWVKDNKGVEEKNTEGGERMEGVEKGKAAGGKKDGERMEGIEKTTANDTVPTSTAPASDDDPASQQLLDETRAALKRKSHAADNGDRKKAVKVTEDERVFIGNAPVKNPTSPSSHEPEAQEEKEQRIICGDLDVSTELALMDPQDAVAYSSLFGGASAS
jgi:hypothetical protein